MIKIDRLKVSELLENSISAHEIVSRKEKVNASDIEVHLAVMARKHWEDHMILQDLIIEASPKNDLFLDERDMYMQAGHILNGIMKTYGGLE